MTLLRQQNQTDGAPSGGVAECTVGSPQGHLMAEQSLSQWSSGCDESKARLKISHMHDILFIELKTTKNTFEVYIWQQPSCAKGPCESGSRVQVARWGAGRAGPRSWAGFCLRPVPGCHNSCSARELFCIVEK